MKKKWVPEELMVKTINLSIDHVTPLDKGGLKFDTENLVPSCSECNTKKSNNIINI